MLRQFTFFALLCSSALVLPLTVAAAEETVDAAFVQTMADFGVTTQAPGVGADVAVGHGTAVTCPGGVAPPGLDPRFCPIGSRHFRFAGVSNNSGGAYGMFHGETFDRFTGETRTTIRGPIFCVTVTGNKAVIGVIAEQVTQHTPGTGITEGAAFYVPMIDNGRNGVVPDLYGPYYLPGLPPADVEGQCTLDFTAFMTVTEGDVLVHDGQVSGNA